MYIISQLGNSHIYHSAFHRTFLTTTSYEMRLIRNTRFPSTELKLKTTIRDLNGIATFHMEIHT